MDIKIQVWLSDIGRSIDEIEAFVADIQSFQDYQIDLKTKKAVERNLEIIGEAAARILRLDNDFNLSNAREIIGTRNRIIHGYDNISDEIIWAIIQRELPILKAEVHDLLS